MRGESCYACQMPQQAQDIDFDFHCHSTVSDGLLTPDEVVRRASNNGVSLLALTDHDDLSGYNQARRAAHTCGVTLICGVEISAEWEGASVHVVGLDVDPQNEALNAGLYAIRVGRYDRAKRMAESLERLGLGAVFEGVLKLADNPLLISRAHFARYLVNVGWCKNVSIAFRDYLVPGKPGYVEHRWASLETALGWIHNAGGIAVLAHPGRYHFSREQVKRLYQAFLQGGGKAIEVESGAHSPEQARRYTQVARRYGLHASRGSDFHGPREGCCDLGALPPLASDLRPVWQLLSGEKQN